MSDLKTYLAAKYMSGPKADAILARSADPTMKKRKKKPRNEDYIGGVSKVEGTRGLVMKDEDEWRKGQQDDEDMEGEDAPTVGKELKTFQKSASKWSTVAGSTLPLPPAPDAAPLSATDIKADPDAEISSPPPPVQITKRKGGLRTAAQLREEAEQAAANRSPSPEAEGGPGPQTTVHRDASGRIVDVEKLKDEAKREEEELKRKEREKEEWGKGLVQRQQRDERARVEKEMGEMDVPRWVQ